MNNFTQGVAMHRRAQNEPAKKYRRATLLFFTLVFFSFSLSATVNLTIHNDGCQDMKVYWKNFFNNEVYYATIQVGGDWSTSTYSGHQWIYRKTNGDHLGGYTVPSSPYHQDDHFNSGGCNGGGGACSEQLAYWDLDDCSAGSSYNEFTADINTPAGFASVNASIFWANGNHSCSYGESGIAVCHEIRDNCSWTNNAQEAYRFSVTIKPTSGNTATLSKLTFYEKAPSSYSWVTGGSGDNDPPSKYGVRVKVGSNEVFKQIDLSTTGNWSLESFDFSNDPDFTVSGETTFDFEILGYCRQGSYGYAVWDIDEIKVYGCSQGPCVNAGGDTDNDGVCDNDDCAPNDPNLPTTPGAACNDGDANTVNDVIQADGCTCAGAFDPCAANGGDSDGDGVCNNQDCAPNDPNLPTTPGAVCNDGNPNTANDVIQTDGCTCAGTPVTPVCDNVTSGGTIGFGNNCQASVLVTCNTAAPAIADCVSPSGGSGALEIIWLKSTTSCSMPTTTADDIIAGLDPHWVWIPGQTGLTLNPGVVTENTCYLRCTRRAGCATYLESNIISLATDCGSGGTPDCQNDITITTDAGSITVSGLDGAPISSLQIFTSNWQPQYSCFANCGATQTVNLPAGSYLVYAKYYTAGYSLICEKQATVTVTGGGGGCPDADNDGACDADDCQPNNPAFPATPGTACDDGNPNTANDAVTADGCGCAGTPTGGGDCENNILITTGNGTITVTGLDGSPVSSLQVFSNTWQQQFSCFANCGATETVTVPAGTYFVFAKYYTAGYSLICEKQATVTVTGGGCPDADSDGTCDADDCQPNNPAFPATPGSACNDGNPNTTNDVVTADGCGCAGTPVQTGCTPSTLVKWDLNACASCTNGSNADWTELTPNVTGNGGCSNVTATSVTPVSSSSTHSCTPGQSGTAMCIGEDTRIKFEVTINGSGGSLSGLSFYEQAPNTYVWDSPNNNCGGAVTGQNNPPSKFDLKIFKNNTLIFSTTKSTQSSWNLRTFDFTGNSDFEVDGTAVFRFEFKPHSANGYGSVKAWDLDEIKVMGCCGITDPCAGQGGDSDGDGICNNLDCQPNDPAFPATPGTACNDGNPNTTNDVVTADGCGCAGTAVDPCAGQGGDSDGDGVCNNQDCQPNDPAFPATPGTACNDGDPNTANDVVTADGCGCQGTPVSTSDCADILITTGTGTITVTGLDGAPISSLQIFNSAWAQQFSCFANCGATETVTVPSGTYFVYAKYYTAGYQLICEKNETVTVTGGGCPDADNDGVCDTDDCQPNNPAFPATPGTPCNDGNPNTSNDVVTTDGCGCAGTVVDPCAAQGGDSDGDGVCNNQDCQPNNPAFPATPGTPCNDGNPNTSNDVVTADGCGCAGTGVEISNCGNHCFVFEGNVDYKVIGNSMSFSEDKTNCNKKTSSSANLSLPGGATIVKAYLQWSGSGSTDSSVKLNGTSVNAQKTYTDGYGSWSFFGAYADVTSLVQGGGNFTVSSLSWNNSSTYCNANAAYGAWSMVVVYSGASAGNSRVHVCQDKFNFTYPDDVYNASIGCVEASPNCPSNAKMTIVTFESDDYKGEYLYIGGQYFGDNNFKGQTAPNLDIVTFSVGDQVNAGTTQLNYSIESYQSNTVWGPAIEGLFDFVKVLKYDVCSGTANPCAAQGGDSDGDGVCDNQDCQPANPAFPATPGTACDDGNPNTANDVVTADGCGCAGTPAGGGNGDCANIQITTGPGSIQVAGLDGAPVTSVQIFSAAWQPVHQCFGNCQSPSASYNVPAGSYHVYVKYYTAGYQLICETNQTVNVSLQLAAGHSGNFQFNAVKHLEHVELLWVHLGDFQVDEYVIERSANGLDFKEIYALASEKDASADVYEGYDLEPLTGMNYYRVKMRNEDGSVSYSDIRTVDYDDLIDFSIFPNPADNFTNINLESIVGYKDVDIHIFNNMGVRMKHFHLDEVWSKYYQVDLRELHEGHYIVWFEIPGKRSLSKQLIIGKL